jgi:hypothetical protein
MGRSDRKLRYLLQDGAIKERDLGWRVAGARRVRVWLIRFAPTGLRMVGSRMKGLVQYKP